MSELKNLTVSGDTRINGNIYANNIQEPVFKRGTGTNSIVADNGSDSTAIGTGAYSEGYKTEASGNYSHAEGDNTSANKENAHAEGYYTIASGIGSHAEGSKSRASGDYSHAEGCDDEDYVEASGLASHAEGEDTTASGRAAHAEGYDTTASGRAAHTEGYGTIANNEGEHAEGRYNKSNTNTTHSVGIGTSSIGRKNAFEVMGNGNAYLYGVGGYDGTNPTTATRLQDVLSIIRTTSSGNAVTLSSEPYNTYRTHTCGALDTNITITISAQSSSSSFSNPGYMHYMLIRNPQYMNSPVVSFSSITTKAVYKPCDTFKIEGNTAKEISWICPDANTIVITVSDTLILDR